MIARLPVDKYILTKDMYLLFEVLGIFCFSMPRVCNGKELEHALSRSSVTSCGDFGPSANPKPSELIYR